MNNQDITPSMLVIVFVIVLLMVISVFLLWPTEAEGVTPVTATLRPTALPGTLTYEVFLPYASYESSASTATPRPTAMK